MILTVVKCIWGPNLETLPSICGDLLAGEAQNGVNFDFEVQFDLEGQGQSPYKTIGILTKVFYTYGPNLVILAWTGDELLCGQASDYRTHGRTDTQTDAGNDNTRRPKLASGKKLGIRQFLTSGDPPIQFISVIKPYCIHHCRVHYRIVQAGK